MYDCFGLTLMVTHECNMRCSYCYAGAKRKRSMPREVGRRAIDRALASLQPGGLLDLGFFGGEPLLCAPLVARLMDYAQTRAEARGARVGFSITTNGTVSSPDAWALMVRPGVNLAISFDGLPEVHDRHRTFADGCGSSPPALRTIRRLIDVGVDFRTVTVVTPDSVQTMPAGVRFLRELGVRHVDLTLDVWARWRPEDAAALERAIEAAARVWREGLPHFSVNWFDEKAARLCGLSLRGTARCGFGDGEIAVAPSGRLYPCERLIGEGREDNPMRLPGHALEGSDFLHARAAPPRSAPACSQCSAEPLCNTTCRCSNYVRTGNVATPDRLLCIWNQACLGRTAEALNEARACAGASL